MNYICKTHLLRFLVMKNFQYLQKIQQQSERIVLTKEVEEQRKLITKIQKESSLQIQQQSERIVSLQIQQEYINTAYSNNH